AEGFGRSLAGLLSAALLLGGWGAWFLLSRVAVYEVTRNARLEVDRAAHPIATPVAGRVAMTHLVVGQEVQAGEVLVELDAEAPRRGRHAPPRHRSLGGGATDQGSRPPGAPRTAQARGHPARRRHRHSRFHARTAGVRDRAAPYSGAGGGATRGGSHPAQRCGD